MKTLTVLLCSISASHSLARQSCLFLQEADSMNVPSDPGIIVFFISFFLIEVWTMLPVVVAILLENFTKAVNADEDQSNRNKLKMSGISSLSVAMLFSP